MAPFFLFFLTAGQSFCEKPKRKVVVDIEKKEKTNAIAETEVSLIPESIRYLADAVSRR
jgi:hypothetical protein